MCCSDKFQRFQQRYLKCFSFLLFLVSIMLLIFSVTLFKPLESKIHAGKMDTAYKVEGNIVAQKLCRFGGALGITLSILAYLTATKKKLYFSIPLAIGTFLLGSMFTAICLMTFSQNSALFFKNQSCNVLVAAGKMGTVPAFAIARTMNVNFIDKMMCSKVCPCAEQYEPLWTAQYAENELQLRNRTWSREPFPK